jgi:hypothetical protein
MLDALRDRLVASITRLRRVRRREFREFRAWVEHTRNLIHLTVILLVPLVIAGVTALSNSVQPLSFLLYPPLASGTYTLFADPEGRYASPWRFVGGLTVGAACGWGALWLLSHVPVLAPETPGVSPSAAALGVFLTGAVTWALDVEEPAAFSTALLALFLGVTDLRYVGGVAVSSTIVAGVFLLWRGQFYERRARYLYQSTKGDDHVLVPMRGDTPEATVLLGARIAAAHDTGKVVLLDVVDQEAVETAAEAPEIEGDSAAERHAATERARDLERLAGQIRTHVGVSCEVVVAVDPADRPATVMRTAHESNCDLIVTPYEERHGALSPYVHELFRGDTDVLVHRSADGRTRWKDVLVPVRRAGDVAHAMIDFASRLAGSTGRVSVCHCLGHGGQRRRAESMLADLVETLSGNVETRVSGATIERFLARNAGEYDLVIIGASTDRTAASRFISPPTFERLRELETDVVVLDRNLRY